MRANRRWPEVLEEPEEPYFRVTQQEALEEPEVGAAEQEAPEEPNVEDEVGDQPQVSYKLEQF
jgi:hypothetical protein